LNKQFDELSKDLASGVSRRSALRRFLVGIGAAAGVLLGRRSAKAENFDLCLDFCAEQYGTTTLEYEECVYLSYYCPPGKCAHFLKFNNRSIFNFDYICEPACVIKTNGTNAVSCVI